MRRFLALSFPAFAVDRFRRRSPGAPPLVLLFTVERGSRWIAALSPEARRLGIARGMSLAQGRAIAGERDLAIEPHDPEADRRSLAELGAFATRFSPAVAVEGDAGLVLDVSGSERLFGGEERLVHLVVEAFARKGFGARGAVAGTLGCAFAVACFAPRAQRRVALRVPPGGEAAALDPLPVAALRIGTDALQALCEVGVETVGELRALPRGALPARFGGELLSRLDQALGTAFEPFVPLRPKRVPRRARAFEVPVELDVVRHAARELLVELTTELRERCEGACRLALDLECAEAPPVREELVLSRPSRDLAHLASLLEPRLERAPLGFGVLRIVLAAPETAPTPERQTGWHEPAGQAEVAEVAKIDRPLGELFDSLVGRLGRAGVLALVPVETHVPERAFEERPLASVETLRARAAITGLARPSRLFAPPAAIEVDAGPAGAPMRLVRNGGARRVLRCFGPERIEPPWWDAPTEGSRDYFCIEDDGGRWLWVFRDPQARWFVHGEWT